MLSELRTARMSSKLKGGVMRVQELMTTPALSIGPEASLKDVATIFVENGITGLPVCDARNHVVGVVSAGDILYKEHDPQDHGGRRRLHWPRGRDAAAIKAKAQIVREAMTSPPITVSPWSSASDAARLMTEQGVNRLPVVKGDTLVGIVTRSDLVRAFIRSDEVIERELREEVLERTMGIDRDTVQIDVRRGVVTLAGMLRTRSDVALLERMTARIPGVVTVTNGLTWNVDDLSRKEKYSAGRL
jgi:CBS domain-containing protein